MTYHRGFSSAPLLAVLGFILILGIGYVALNPSVLHAPTRTTAEDDRAKTEVTAEADSTSTSTHTRTSIVWRLTDAGEVHGAIPQTDVTVTIDGTAYVLGKFQGSCSELGANGGIDGKGLLAGELSAVQCWFAGGGDEIGVFAHEDGGYDILVGDLSEGEEGAGLFRGDFKVIKSITP